MFLTVKVFYTYHSLSFARISRGAWALCLVLNDKQILDLDWFSQDTLNLFFFALDHKWILDLDWFGQDIRYTLNSNSVDNFAELMFAFSFFFFWEWCLHLVEVSYIPWVSLSLISNK